MLANNSTNLPEGYALLGGLATTVQDSHIAIAWIVLFSLLLLLNIARGVACGWYVWNSAEFACTLLIVKNGLRFASSHSGTLNTSRIVAEQVLIMLAYNFFFGSVSGLLEANLAILPDDLSTGGWIGSFLIDTLLSLCTPAWLAGMILGSWADGSLLRLDEGSQSVSEVVIRCRTASAILFLTVACIFCLCAIWGLLNNPYTTGRRGFLLILMSTLLIVSTAYTMSIYKHHDPPSDFTAKGKAIFAVIFELPLFLLGFLLMSLHLPVEFGNTDEDQKLWTDKPWDKSWTWKKTWGGKETTTVTRIDQFGRQTTQTFVEYPV